MPNRHAAMLAAILCLAGCGGGGGGGETEPAPATKTFALGVEYMEPGLANAYGATGVTWAKTRLESFEWEAIEPNAPVAGVHTYDWTCTDVAVSSYQAAGMVNLQSYLSSSCAWGNEDQALDIMPAPNHMASYRAFVRALIERYDADGLDDMPGLLAPIREWVVGPEWTGFWPSGDATDYIELLRVTREEARAASADVRLGTIPFLLLDVFEGNEPSEAEITARLSATTPVGRQDAAGIQLILDRPDLFDAVSIHSLGDYTEVAPTLRWFRQQMAQRGYDRPLWFDDAFPMSLLTNISWPIFYPLQGEEDRAPVLAVLDSVADLEHDDHANSKAWIEAQVAAGLVRKVVTAMGEGAAGIQIGNTEDWMHDDFVPLRRFNINLIGAAAMMGAIDVTHPTGDYGHCDPRVAGAARPAWYAIQQCVAHIGSGGYERAERIGGLTGVRGYIIHTASSWWAAVWYEDDVLQLPGTTELRVSTSIPLPNLNGAITYERAVTVGTTPEAGSGTITAGQLTLALALDSIPVFITPASP